MSSACYISVPSGQVNGAAPSGDAMATGHSGGRERLFRSNRKLFRILPKHYRPRKLKFSAQFCIMRLIPSPSGRDPFDGTPVLSAEPAASAPAVFPLNSRIGLGTDLRLMHCVGDGSATMFLLR